MNFFPKKLKYKKVRKGSLPNKILSNSRQPQYGTLYLKSVNFGILSSKEIDSGRKLILKKIKKKGKLWVRIFPGIPITKKPVEVRMGKGKGSVHSWICKVRPGTILYEVEGINQKLANEVFGEVSKKLSLRTKVSMIC